MSNHYSLEVPLLSSSSIVRCVEALPLCSRKKLRKEIGGTFLTAGTKPTHEHSCRMVDMESVHLPKLLFASFKPPRTSIPILDLREPLMRDSGRMRVLAQTLA